MRTIDRSNGTRGPRPVMAVPAGACRTVGTCLAVLLATPSALHAHTPAIPVVEIQEVDIGQYILEIDASFAPSPSPPELSIPANFQFDGDPRFVKHSDASRIQYRFRGSSSLARDCELLLILDQPKAIVIMRWSSGDVHRWLQWRARGGIRIHMGNLGAAPPPLAVAVRRDCELGVRHGLHPEHVLLAIAAALLAPGAGAIRLLMWMFAGTGVALVITEMRGAELPLPVAELACLLAAALVARRILLGAPDRSHAAVFVVVGWLHALGLAAGIAPMESLERELSIVVAFHSGVFACQVCVAVITTGLLAASRRLSEQIPIAVTYALGAGAAALLLFAFCDGALWRQVSRAESRRMAATVNTEAMIQPDALAESSALPEFVAQTQPDDGQPIEPENAVNVKPPPAIPIPVTPQRWPICSTLITLASSLLFLRVFTSNALRWIACSGLCVSVLVYPYVRTTVDVPLLARTTDQQHLEAILAGLLQNVYRALEHPDEMSVYEQLETSVTGDKLSEIYLQHRRDRQTQNAARVRIDDITLWSVSKPTTDSAGRLTFDASWTVTGGVNHFGHRHYRRNLYSANLSVIPVDGNWKIDRLQILDEHREF